MNNQLPWCSKAKSKTCMGNEGTASIIQWIPFNCIAYLLEKHMQLTEIITSKENT